MSELELLAQLDALLAAAQPIPLLDEVRIDRRRALDLARQLGGTELVRTFESARRVPLTGQVRVDPQEVRELLDGLRRAFTAEKPTD
jgi:hypothetical protein